MHVFLYTTQHFYHIILIFLRIRSFCRIKQFVVYLQTKDLSMENFVRYGVGEQSFEVMQERNCLYVDKTKFIEDIVRSGGQYYFLGRQRRFGKSLFLSTLKCFLQGRRELFKGLYVDSMDWDWEQSP